MALTSLTPSVVLGTISAILFARIAWEYLFSPLKAFPGPLASRFTDGWRAYLATRGDVDRKHRQWHRHWGSAVRVGPNTISLSDPALIKVVYASKNAWRKSDMYRVNDVMVDGQRVQNIFNTQDKAFHAKYSKPMGGLWTLSKVLDLEPLVDETLRELVQKLDEKFASKGAVCMMEDWISYYTWDAMGNVSWGKGYGFIQAGHDVDGIISESTAGLNYFVALSQIPWLDNWLDKNTWYRLGPRPLVNGFLYALRTLTEYQQEVESCAPRRKEQELFIDRYSKLKEHYDYVDDRQVLQYLLANVLAGGDSTSGAIRPVFYLLAKHQDKYQKLVAELDGAQLSFPAQWKDLVKLPYLNACIRESFRLHPGAGLIMEREVPDGGFTLPDGRFIPAKTKVGLSPCVVTRDTGVYSDDVDDYVPERWFQREEESDEDYASRLRKMQEVTDFMFGAGSRVCVGKNMAKLEMYKLVATLYSTFDIKLRNPEHEWKYCNSWFMYHNDIPMVLVPRRAA